MGVRAIIELKLDSTEAFGALVDELSTSLSQLGMRLELGPHGRVTEGAVEVGRVVSQPMDQIMFEWRQADWQQDEVTMVALRFEPIQDGTRVILEHHNRSPLVGDQEHDLAGWFASQVAAPLLRATTPDRLGDWITDRLARRPSGPQSRENYRDPLYHRPNFRAILKALALGPEDYLLEVGCGGGAFLDEALRSGCKAAAIDHSSEMVGLARKVNHEAIQENRLEVREGEADSLPYPGGIFTCAVMTGVFGFIPEPLKALSEIRRVLGNNGRLALFCGTKELRGTPAAPEPIASRMRFYEDEELQELACSAGFDEAHVEHPDLEQFARDVGVPESHVGMFSRRAGGQLLLARKK